MSYRDDIDALAARHAALEQEVADKARERDTAGQLLDEARARAKPPVLDDMRVAAPCSAAWEKMVGDDRVRLCGDCNKHVYNLSGMTREEAEALVAAKEGRLCVRYFERADGTILLADCTVGRRRKQKRRIVAFGAAALLAGGVVAYKLTRPEPVRVVIGAEPRMTEVKGNIAEPQEVRGRFESHAYSSQQGGKEGR